MNTVLSINYLYQLPFNRVTCSIECSNIFRNSCVYCPKSTGQVTTVNSRYSNICNSVNPNEYSYLQLLSYSILFLKYCMPFISHPKITTKWGSKWGSNEP